MDIAEQCVPAASKGFLLYQSLLGITAILKVNFSVFCNAAKKVSGTKIWVQRLKFY